MAASPFAFAVGSVSFQPSSVGAPGRRRRRGRRRRGGRGRRRGRAPPPSPDHPHAATISRHARTPADRIRETTPSMVAQPRAGAASAAAHGAFRALSSVPSTGRGAPMSEMTGTASPWYRPMRARRPDEAHRASTPLELLFDLCFVVAVAQAAAELHHAVAEDHVGARRVVGYLMVFFAIWWAWMNFTWFASAYDTDDVAVPADDAGADRRRAGPRRRGAAAFDERDFAIVTVGYVIMRLALVAQWLRAAARRPGHRRIGAALRRRHHASCRSAGCCACCCPTACSCPAFLRAGRRRAGGAGRGPSAAGMTAWHPQPHRRAVRAVHPHRARRVGAGGHGRDPGRVRRRTERPGRADHARRRRAAHPRSRCGGSTSSSPPTNG